MLVGRLCSIIFISILFSYCTKESKKTEQNHLINQTIPSDSIINSNLKQKFNKSRNDSLIAAEDKYFRKLKIALKDSSGIILGAFESAEMGDYAHITIKDTSGLSISFYLDDQLNIPENTWNEMLDGKFNEKKVRVNWKRKKFLDPIHSKKKVEVITKLQFDKN
jgi:hypothetical protein